MGQEVRFALRGLAKEPGFTAVAVLTLALGIGGTTALFGIVDSVLLRPLAFEEPERLLRVLSRNSFPDMQDWMAQTGTFETFGGYNAWSFDLKLASEPERIAGAVVTGELLPMLGIPATRGRILGPSDDVPGGERVVVLAHAFWKTRLAEDSNVVGRALSLSGQPYSIVGVMPEAFRLPGVDAAFFVPHRVVAPESAAARGAHYLVAVGRLKDGVSLDEAQADLDVIAGRLEELYPDENTGRRFILAPWREELGRESRPTLLLFFGAVGFVLLIACANVAGLALARTVRREREIALRSALGAGRARIAQPFLVESLLVGVCGGLAGLLLAVVLTRLTVALAAGNIPRLDEAVVDVRVLAFAAALSVGTGIAFGLAPALLAARRLSLRAALAEGPRSAGAGPHRIRSVLIVVEVALAVSLLAGAGLLIQSLHRLGQVDPGFEGEGLVTMEVSLPLPEYRDIPARVPLFESLIERLSRLPGVDGVALTTDLPFGSGSVPHNLAVEGMAVPVGSEPEIFYRGVNGTYFEVMGIPLVQGRAISDQDRDGTMPVAVANEAFVRDVLSGEDALGRRVRWARRDEVRWITLVGVARDVKPFGLDGEEVPALYVPFRQEQEWWRSWMNVAVRTTLPPDVLVPSIRRAAAEWSSDIPVANLGSMTSLVAASGAGRRFQLFVFGSFAAAALLLAAVGLYGLLSHRVSERRAELGIRLALGAEPKGLSVLVLGQGLKLALLGLVCGSLLAYGLSRMMTSLLFEVSGAGPEIYAAIATALLLTASLASFVPAYRASRVDPLVSIRTE